MRKYIYIGVILLAVILVTVITIQGCSLKKYKKLCDKQLQNIEAYQEANAGLEGEIRQYQMTIDELYASNDVKDKKISDVLNKLKIKDKNVTDLQYQVAHSKKTDTISFVDTVFVDKFVSIDTFLGDEWYSLYLHLEYPSTVVVSPEFRSEQYVIIHKEKKCNKGECSKCFLKRWFQKKHWVTEVTVEEKNPYVDISEQKYIKIDK